MSELSDDKLLIYNREGMIPGPGEKMASFSQRADYCFHLRQHLGAKLPFSQDAEAPPTIMQAAAAQTRRQYDIAPTWVPIFFSNYQLMPWHGGCAWIFQLSDEEPTTAFFQLRQAFRDRSNYLGLYSRNELMAHELVHVGRMMFEEPKYEEMLAYRTSKSPWRRWLGPLVQSSAESAWFVFFLLPIILLDLYLLISGSDAYYWKVMWLKLIPLSLICAALVRLWKRQSTFNNTLHKLQSIFHAPEAVIYRLTDNEIECFAKSSVAEIMRYMHGETSLRWHIIRLAYAH